MSWLQKKIVVVPIDFSEVSFEALAAARDLVEDASSLHVVYVLPVMEPAEPGVIWQTIDDASRQRHAEQALREKLDESKYQGVDLKIAFGDPGHEITAYAEQLGAELIVLPSHGRTGLKRMLIGSVAERVVRLAHCPVLVMRE